MFIGDRRKLLGTIGVGLVSPAILGCAPNLSRPTETSTAGATAAAKLKDMLKPTEQRTQQRPENHVVISKEDVQWNRFHRQHYYTENEQEKSIALPQAKQFMKVPIKAEDLHKAWVSQGWEINPDETEIDYVTGHQAVDISAPYGTEVLAPCSGWLVLSLQEGWRTGEKVGDKIVPMYKGQKIAYAGGLFGQICTPWDEYVQTLHLSKIHDSLKGKLKFSIPTTDGKGGWDPANTILRSEQLKTSPFTVWVETGQPIGHIGTSGLGLGHLGAYKGEEWPNEFLEKDCPTWDPVGPHIHLEVFFRNEKGNKYGRRDPFAIYGPAKLYSLDGKSKLGKEPMFLTDANGTPLLAA